MRILVCGGRNYGHVVRTKALTEDEPPETQARLREYKHIHNTLAKLVYENSRMRNDHDNWLPTDIEIIAGGATGADSAAIDFALVQHCSFRIFEASWKKHGKAAGPMRNALMLSEGQPDLVVAFPGGKGTANMVKQAREAGIPVMEIDAD